MKPSIALALLATLALAGCKKQQATPPPQPSKVLVDALRDYCKIGTLPKEQQKDAQKVWGWQTASTEVGPVFARVAKKDPAAIALVLAAADEAVGKGNCPILDVIR